MIQTYIKLAIGIAGYVAWAIMAFIDPTLRTDFLRFNIAMAMGTIGLVLRDMAPPSGKQGGAAMPGFLAMLGLGAALSLAGCATPLAGQPAATPQQAVQVSYTQACATYLAGMQVAIDLRRVGKLNQSQIDQITIIDNQVAPICTGPLPTDPTQAAQQVTAAVTTLAILEVINKEQKP